jgi:hypothetical protein
VNAFLLVGGRLLALAGDNGMVFRNDPGESDWTVSNLDNIGVHAGLQASTGVFTGTAWVIGSNSGVFRSTAGQEPWTRTALAIGAVSWTALAVKDGRVYGAFNLSSDAVIGESVDNGATWQNAEVQQNVFVQKMAISGGELYAARNDGLWRRPLTVTAVTPGGGTNPLRFAVAGPQPFGSGTRVRFELPSAGSVSIELFDVQGRLVGDRIERSLSAGRHDMPIDGGRLGSGVYIARLTAGGSQQVVRLVHVK